MRTSLVIFLLCSAAVACRPVAPSPTVLPPSETRPDPVDTPPVAHAGDDPMAIDEASFARLHEKRTDAAPPARGIELEIAGAKAYLSLPPGAVAPLPAVLVIHEIWGLNDHIRHWTDRLAADGYAALAIDLFDTVVPADREAGMAAMKAVDEARAQAVLDAAHRFLHDDPRIAATRRGVIGWCFGGGWSLRQAIAQPDLDAAIIYYGRLVVDETALRKIDAELLGIFADRDQGIPPAAVAEFVAALEHAGKRIEIHHYDAEHAFANPSGARYDAAAAEDAWGHVRAFLARTLR